MSPNRAIYFRSQLTMFVILFVERAGSTYLTTLLDSHPDIVAHREEFSVLKQKGKGAAEQLHWAGSFFTPPLFGRTKARGFKTKLVDVLDPEGFARLLQEKRTRVIQLQRRNTIKGAVSTINAKRLWDASGNWNLLKESDRRSPFKIELEELNRQLKLRETWDHELEAYVEKLGLPTLPLYYEDLLKNEQAFLEKIFAFLEVLPKPVKGITLKHTNDNLREVLLNFDDLRRSYAGTPYETMFDEVLV